ACLSNGGQPGLHPQASQPSPREPRHGGLTRATRGPRAVHGALARQEDQEHRGPQRGAVALRREAFLLERRAARAPGGGPPPARGPPRGGEGAAAEEAAARAERIAHQDISFREEKCNKLRNQLQEAEMALAEAANELNNAKTARQGADAALQGFVPETWKNNKVAEIKREREQEAIGDQEELRLALLAWPRPILPRPLILFYLHGSTISDPEEIARELADIRKRSLEHALTNEQAERMEKLMSKQARVKGAKRARVAGTKVGQTFKRLLAWDKIVQIFSLLPDGHRWRRVKGPIVATIAVFMDLSWCTVASCTVLAVVPYVWSRQKKTRAKSEDFEAAQISAMSPSPSMPAHTVPCQVLTVSEAGRPLCEFGQCRFAKDNPPCVMMGPVCNRKAMLCKTHYKIFSDGLGYANPAMAMGWAREIGSRPKIQAMERNVGKHVDPSQLQFTPASVEYEHTAGMRCYRFATALNKIEWEKAHHKTMTAKLPIPTHPVAVLPRCDGSGVFEKCWLFAWSPFSGCRTVEIGNDQMTKTVTPIMKPSQHLYSEQAVDAANFVGGAAQSRFMVCNKDFAGLPTLPGSVHNVVGEPALHPLGYSVADFLESGFGEDAFKWRSGYLGPAVPVCGLRQRVDGKLLDAAKYLSILDCSVAQRCHHHKEYAEKDHADPNNAELKQRLVTFGLCQRFNPRHEGDYTYEVFVQTADQLRGRSACLVPHANAVIWKKRANEMQMTTSTDGDAEAFLTACAPVALPGQTDEAFDIRKPVLCRLSALTEAEKIQRFYHIFIVGWFLPKLENGCSEMVCLHVCTKLRQYIKQIIETFVLSATAVQIFVELASLLRALQDCAAMDAIMSPGFIDRCNTLKALSDTRSVSRLTKTFAVSVSSVDKCTRAICEASQYVAALQGIEYELEVLVEELVEPVPQPPEESEESPVDGLATSIASLRSKMTNAAKCVARVGPASRAGVAIVNMVSQKGCAFDELAKKRSNPAKADSGEMLGLLKDACQQFPLDSAMNNMLTQVTDRVHLESEKRSVDAFTTSFNELTEHACKNPPELTCELMQDTIDVAGKMGAGLLVAESFKKMVEGSRIVGGALVKVGMTEVMCEKYVALFGIPRDTFDVEFENTVHAGQLNTQLTMMTVCSQVASAATAPSNFLTGQPPHGQFDVPKVAAGCAVSKAIVDDYNSASLKSDNSWKIFSSGEFAELETVLCWEQAIRKIRADCARLLHNAGVEIKQYMVEKLLEDFKAFADNAKGLADGKDWLGGYSGRTWSGLLDWSKKGLLAPGGVAPAIKAEWMKLDKDAKTIAAAMKPYGVAPFTWTVEQEQIIAQGKATHAQCVILGAFVPIKDASPRSLAVAQAYRNCTGTGGKFDSLHDLIRKKIAPMVQ
ncbi:unnamed protein product, partial [Prorocentrum cordatum]